MGSIQRKVRAPQNMAPGNSRGFLSGERNHRKCNRKYTAAVYVAAGKGEKVR